MIVMENVSKEYKNGVHALRDINLAIDDGEFVYIIGPTGSGKSTLIKLLDGKYQCGKAEAFPCAGLPQKYRGRISGLPSASQTYNL